MNLWNMLRPPPIPDRVRRGKNVLLVVTPQMKAWARAEWRRRRRRRLRAMLRWAWGRVKRAVRKLGKKK